jgi:hypothetical protein
MKKQTINTVLYARRSLEDEAGEMMSFEAQKYELNVIAKRGDQHISEVIEKRRLPKKRNRFKFSRLIERVRTTLKF